MEIKDKDIMELWRKTVKCILEEGNRYIDNNNRVCHEIINSVLILENISKEEIEKPINHIKNFNQWIYPTKDELIEVMFKDRHTPFYEYTYGGRIFNFEHQKNQIKEFILPLLKMDKESRRGVINIYNPITDSDVNNKNTPGMIYLNVRIKQNKLSLTAHIRSADILFGWPANICQLFAIQEYITNELNLSLGDLTIIGNSIHLFIDSDTALLDSLKS